MVDPTPPQKLTATPQQTPPPDFVAYPEHKENQSLVKLESKEFLV